MSTTYFPIDRALAHVKGVTSEDVAGAQRAWNVLLHLKMSATSITRAKKLSHSDNAGSEVWEVTLEVQGPPDHSCLYVLVPSPRGTAGLIGPGRNIESLKPPHED